MTRLDWPTLAELEALADQRVKVLRGHPDWNPDAPGLAQAARAERERLLGQYRRAILGTPCWYCGWMAERMVREHVTPQSRGGTDQPGNLVPACQGCNVAKGASTLEEYRAQLAALSQVEPAAVVFYGESPEGAWLAPHLAPDPAVPCVYWGTGSPADSAAGKVGL